jgi:hypothetical protein
MQDKPATPAVPAAETIRRAFVWAGVILGAAIVLNDLIEPTEFTYLLGIFIIAWIVDQAPPFAGRAESIKWAGPVSAAIILAIAIATKVVMEW